MKEVGAASAAARDAIARLALAVAGLEKPRFDFSRSIQLLEQLAKWAEWRRQIEALPDAEILPRALAATLEKGCQTRSPGTSPVPTAPAAQPSSKAAVGSGWSAAAAGQKGGESKSPAKVAAARKNIKALNERRWGQNRKRRRGP